MRMMVGLDRPSAGSVRVNGTAPDAHAAPLHEVGALLVATALLGDPATLVLDEPINGLDLDGIRWIRSLLKGLAAEGRTVFLSSHLMSEMALTADHVIVVGKGRLLCDQPMAGFIEDASSETVRVRSGRTGRLARLVEDAGATVTVDGEALIVEGLSSDEIGTMAARARITVLELSPQSASLEDAYLALTRDSLDYRTGDRVGRGADGGGLSSDEGAA